MDSAGEKEIRDNQKEIFKRLGDTEKQNVAQVQINNNISQSHKFLEEKLEEKISHLEESLADKMLSMTEILSTQLKQIQLTTSKTNGNVLKNRDDIDTLQRNEVRFVEMSKDMESLKKTCDHQDDEIDKLRNIVEPIKTAQRFPQMIRYTIIGFIIVVIISMWGILAITKTAKNTIEEKLDIRIEKPVEKPTTN